MPTLMKFGKDGNVTGSLVYTIVSAMAYSFGSWAEQPVTIDGTLDIQTAQ
jgi:hypothetical protein